MVTRIAEVDVGSLKDTDIREASRALNSLAHFSTVGDERMGMKDQALLEPLSKRGMMARDILMRLLEEESCRKEEPGEIEETNIHIADNKMYHEVSLRKCNFFRKP